METFFIFNWGFCTKGSRAFLLHPGQAIGFFYLKSNVFWSIIQQSFNLRICFLYFFYSTRICRQKKTFKKNDKKISLLVQIVIGSHSFLEYWWNRQIYVTAGKLMGKRQYLTHYWSNYSFKGTVQNQHCHLFMKAH